jgi:hypothetical protein
VRYSDERAHQRSLFDKGIDRVLRALSFDDHGVLRRFYSEAPESPQVLSKMVDDHLAEFEALVDKLEFLDLPLARLIGAQCHLMLAHLDSQSSDDERRLVQAAVRYFVHKDDSECDNTSPIGFDDDAEVAALVARELDVDSLFGIQDGKQ